jgi:hypothetical protein
MKRSVRSTYEIGAEIMATYLHKPRTRREVKEQVGLGSETEPNWFRQMRASGVLRCVGWRRPINGVGRNVAVYGLQAPFSQPDEPYGSMLVG